MTIAICAHIEHPVRMPLPTSMHAMEIHSNALHACRLPLPIPMAGELLIQVAYAGINRADLLQIAGNYAPPAGASPLPGLEVSGHVAALGEGVHSFTPGQEVCALLSGGGYAEYVTVPAMHTLRLPTGITLREAASLPEAAATSIMALIHEGRLQPGERVLIHGGTSGVGILMAQIANRMGAEVLATVSNEAKAARLTSFNVVAINRHAAPFAAQVMAATENQGVDLIIDTLGGPQVETHLRLLRPRGRLVTLAMLEGSALPPAMKMTRIPMNNLCWSGATLRHQSDAQKAAILREVAATLWPNLENGTIKSVIDSVFPLVDAEKALLRMQERLHMGKILLEVGPKSAPRRQ